MNKWRFIDSGFSEPDYNMNLDRALLASFFSKDFIPTFRLYGWIRPAISLGCFQKPGQTLNLKKCKKEGVDIVERISGGFGIYHSQYELTYSLVCPDNFINSRSIKDSYKEITYFLIKAYREVGLDAHYVKDGLDPKPAANKRADFCLSQLQDYDIVIDGKKIGGNAQKRKRGVIFQHGSIPFKYPVDPGSYFLRKEQRQNKYLSLSELGVFDFNNFKKILLDSFQNHLGVEFITEQINLI